MEKRQYGKKVSRRKTFTVKYLYGEVNKRRCVLTTKNAMMKFPLATCPSAKSPSRVTSVVEAVLIDNYSLRGMGCLYVVGRRVFFSVIVVMKV